MSLVATSSLSSSLVYCSTDVAHGSWWFVWGSLVAMLMAVIPLVQVDVNIFQATDDTLPVMDFYSTWALLIISGFFFTVGSYCFVRAFEEPPKPPLFTWKHFETDELLGAWLFFFGAAPAVPYAAIYWILYPTELLYLGALAAAVIFVLASLLFVFACYPSDKVDPSLLFLVLLLYSETSTNYQTYGKNLLWFPSFDYQTYPK